MPFYVENSFGSGLFGGRAQFTVIETCAVSPETVTVGSNSFDLACAPFVVCVDHDGEHVMICQGDCNDANASQNPQDDELVRAAAQSKRGQQRNVSLSCCLVSLRSIFYGQVAVLELGLQAPAPQELRARTM